MADQLKPRAENRIAEILGDFALLVVALVAFYVVFGAWA